MNDTTLYEEILVTQAAAKERDYHVRWCIVCTLAGLHDLARAVGMELHPKKIQEGNIGKMLGMEIYWDEACMAEHAPGENVRMVEESYYWKWRKTQNDN